jgi:hypothetical protein
MTIDAKDVALAGAAVGGIYLLSARGDAGGQKRRRRRKGGGGGGSGGGGATPGPAGVIPVPVPGGGGGGSGPVNLPGGGGGSQPVGEETAAAVEKAKVAIDAAKGTGEAADAVLDTGSSGIDYVADTIGGDAPGAFSTSGGLTGASYEAGQLTGNVADEVTKAVDNAPAPVVGGVPELLSEGPF